MAEYSRIAKGHVTTLAGGGTPFINLPFQPELVKWKNFTASTSGGATGYVPSGYWDVSMGQGAAIYEVVTATTLALTTATTLTGGVSSFSAGLSLQYGPVVLLGASGGIAKTSSTVLTVTTTAAHGLVPGNWVTFQNLYETSTTGMQQIAGIPFEVQSVGSTTTFTVSWVGNSANLTAITAGGLNTLAGFKQILYPCLYVPGVSVPWSIAQSAGVVTVNTTAACNFVVGQEIAFRIPAVYGAVELNESQGDILRPGSQKYFYVTSVDTATNNCSFTFNYSGPLTAFTVNTGLPNPMTFSGLRFPEVFAVGDINTGGTLYSGGQLYPSPNVFGENQLLSSPTINGPAISGAYINNTSQGFVIGSTVAPTGSQVIYWEAVLSDLSIN